MKMINVSGFTDWSFGLLYYMPWLMLLLFY